MVYMALFRQLGNTGIIRGPKGGIYHLSSSGHKVSGPPPSHDEKKHAIGETFKKEAAEASIQAQRQGTVKAHVHASKKFAEAAERHPNRDDKLTLRSAGAEHLRTASIIADNATKLAKSTIDHGQASMAHEELGKHYTVLGNKELAAHHLAKAKWHDDRSY